jgi:hypothetical protein
MLNMPFPTIARFLRWKLIRCEQKDAVDDGSVQLKTYSLFLSRKSGIVRASRTDE